MDLTCVAIDDEPLALELISTYAKRIQAINLVYSFEDAISGSEYLMKNPVDLLFLDINMPDINGIDLARTLRSDQMIIFTTAYKQFAYEGFQLDAVDYLLKPIAFEAFFKACQKAINLKAFRTNPVHPASLEYIYVHSAYRLLKVAVSDIVYLESMEDYIKIHLCDQKPVLTLMSMKKMLEMLPEGQFLRIHRSYIVPLAKIRSIQQKKVLLADVVLPIGDRYAAQLRDRF